MGTCFGQFLTSQEYELRVLGENYHYSFMRVRKYYIHLTNKIRKTGSKIKGV